MEGKSRKKPALRSQRERTFHRQRKCPKARRQEEACWFQSRRKNVSVVWLKCSQHGRVMLARKALAREWRESVFYFLCEEMLLLRLAILHDLIYIFK
jgi:hypothetical protein